MSFRHFAQQAHKTGFANRSLHEDGSIHEARDIWTLGYTKHGWTCLDEKCRAKMIPCAWTHLGENGRFHDSDGVPFKRPPYFRAATGHHPGCNASHPHEPRESQEPAYRLGPPVDYPSRVILLQHAQCFATSSPDEVDPESDEPTERKHARWARSIREACEFFVSHPGEHWRPLRVDFCNGARCYAECFVRFGTGNRAGAGKHRIFYDEVLFRKWVNLDAEPIRLDLLGSIGNKPRTLVIHTKDWLLEHRRELQSRLRAALKESRAAFREGRPERPWIFAVTRERSYDEPEIEVDLQPAVDVLLCAMPRLDWCYRPSHQFPRRHSYQAEDWPEPGRAQEGTAVADRPAATKKVAPNGVAAEQADQRPTGQPDPVAPHSPIERPEEAPVRQPVQKRQTLARRVKAAVAKGARRLSWLWRLRN